MTYGTEVLIPEYPIYCGGEIYFGYENEHLTNWCFLYDGSEWVDGGDMREIRKYAQSVQLTDSTFWVAGKY